AIALGDFLAALMKGGRIGEIVRESLTIGGWVSMWRLSRFSCTTGGRFAVKLGFLSGLQRCRYASDTRTPQVPMRGEKTGQWCRQEVNGRAARPDREL